MLNYQVIEEIEVDASGEEDLAIQKKHFNNCMRRAIKDHLIAQNFPIPVNNLVVLDVDEVVLRTYVEWKSLENVWASFEKIRKIGNNRDLFREYWDYDVFDYYLEQIEFGDLPPDRKHALFKLLRYAFNIWYDKDLKKLLCGQGVDDKQIARNPYFIVLALKNYLTEKFGIVKGLLDLETIDYMESLGATILFMTSRAAGSGMDRLKEQLSEIGFKEPTVLTMAMWESNDASVLSRKIMSKGRVTKGDLIDEIVKKFGFVSAILVDDTFENIRSLLKFDHPKYYAIHYQLKLNYQFEDYCIDLNRLKGGLKGGLPPLCISGNDLGE